MDLVTSMDKPFSEIVSARLSALETNAFAVEKQHGLKSDTIRSVIRTDQRRATPNIDRAKEICDALGLEFYIGPPRETGSVPHAIIEDHDYATVSYYDVSASAGPGVVPAADAAVENFAFRRDWLKRQGVAPQNAALLRVKGESMSPLISDGDILLIDTARKEPPIRPQTSESRVRSGIYVVDVDGETRVKRVERPDFQNLILYSEDTTKFAPEAFLGRDQQRLNFVGKVIWWGHTVEI